MVIFSEASNNDLNTSLLIEENSLCKEDIVPGWWWPKAPISIVRNLGASESLRKSSYLLSLEVMGLRHGLQ